MNTNTKHPRGDINVTIGDVSYTMKPTFEAIAAIEATLQRSAHELSIEITSMRLKGIKYTLLTSIVFQAINANPANKKAIADNNVTFNKVGAEITDRVADFIEPIATFLLAYAPQSKSMGEEQAADPK